MPPKRKKSSNILLLVWKTSIWNTIIIFEPVDLCGLEAIREVVILVSRRWGEGQTLLYLWSQTIKQLNPWRSWEWKTMHCRINIAEVFHFIWTRQNLYMRVLKLVFKHLRCLYACWNEAVPVLCNSYLYMKIIDTKLSWNLCVACLFRFCFCSKVNHITGVTQQINVKTRISLTWTINNECVESFFSGWWGGGR